MLSIEPIQITKSEFKRLLLAAVLMPPVCTLAGMLVVMSATPTPGDAGVSTAARAANTVLVADTVPRLELAPPAESPVAQFTLMPAVATTFNVAPTLEPEIASLDLANDTPQNAAPQVATPTEPAAEPAVLEQSDAVAAMNAVAAREPASISTQAPAESADPNANGHFVVQAGMFSKESNARRCREMLLRRGVSSAVIEHVGKRGMSYHVVLGRYESWREADRARRQLTAELHIELFATRLPLRSIAQQVAAI